MRIEEDSHFSGYNHIANETLLIIEAFRKEGKLDFRSRRYLRSISAAMIETAMLSADRYWPRAKCRGRRKSGQFDEFLELLHLVNDCLGFAGMSRDDEWEESFLLSCGIIVAFSYHPLISESEEIEIVNDFWLTVYERTAPCAQKVAAQ